MTEESAEAFEIFYSYAHKDEKQRDELDKHLYNLQRQGLITEWYDRDISAGTEWEHEIDTHLNSAHVILLLISPDFMASKYCYSIEMKRALERHKAGEVRVIPIILRPVDWQGAPFSKLQALPKNAKAVTRWRNQDEAFVDIATGIRKSLKKLRVTLSENTALSPAHPKDTSKAASDSIPTLLVVKEAELAPVWKVPYRQNPFFTDRENILQQLRDMFTKEGTASVIRPVVLSGLGGIGKTQIVVEYAHRHRQEYHVVLWAKADSSKVLASELASFASLLNLPGKREQDQQYAMDAVKRWLEVHSNWLLILDNIEDLKMVYEYLPTEPRGHILLTTRTQVIGGIAQRLDIEKLAAEDGALLLLRRAGLLTTTDTSLESASEHDRMQARAIVEALDGLPLAIDQAGAYIEETGASLQGYLDLYASRQNYFLKERGGLVSDHPESVTTTLSLSFEKVKQENPAVAELLRFLAFLHPDAIPDELIRCGASQSGPILQAVANDPLELNNAIGELRKYSLVRRNPDSATLTIHRLVQAVLKDDMDEQTQRQWSKRVVRAVNQVFPKVEFATWQACQQYLPQAQICSVLIATWHFVFPEAARLLHEAGKYLHERGQYIEAAPLIAQALAIREQTQGAEDLDVADSLNELAELYRHQGKYAEAEPLYQRALTIRENVLGPIHPDVATSLNNLARPYHHLARYAEAEPLYQRALVIREQSLGAEHPDVAHSMNDLALLYYEQGSYAKAEPPYERALAIREQVLGPNHPATAISLDNLATLYREQGRYTEAERLQKRSLTIREQVLGPNHPATAISLGNLASLYMHQDNYTEAVPPLKRALAIQEQVLGPNHPDTATSLNNLATLYAEQGNYTEAERLQKRSLVIYEKALGPNHPDTATSLYHLASLYMHKRLYILAEPLLKRALAIDEQMLRPGHPDTLKIWKTYIQLLQATGRKEKAAEMEARLRSKHLQENQEPDKE
jgi:tetratricopeptide (TPR) repeat protein